MVRVLYPINLDRWKFPVSSSLRELTVRNPQIDFYSFSSPTSDEDRQLSQTLWSQTHIHKITTLELVRQRFDIVHHASATPRNLAAAAIAKARSFGQCVHIFTAPIQPHETDQFYREYVQSVQTADVLAAVSYAVANDLEQKFNRKVDAVIPSGVDLNFFAPAAAQPVNFEQLGIRQPYVLFVGILTQRKRPDVFMQIAELLPDVDFVMAGAAYTPEEQDYWQSLATKHANVKLLGGKERSIIRDLMAQAIALVFPSELEGLPLTILEASAMGLPILAQPKSAMPEAVIDDITGWLYPADRPAVWAEKLNAIMQWSDTERQAFATKARMFVSEHYTWDVVAKQYAELYQRVKRS